MIQKKEIFFSGPCFILLFLSSFDLINFSEPIRDGLSNYASNITQPPEIIRKPAVLRRVGKLNHLNSLNIRSKIWRRSLMNI